MSMTLTWFYPSMPYQYPPKQPKIVGTAHGQAIHRNFDQKTHNTKLVHDILPTNHRVHRMTRPDPPNVHCASIWMKIEIIFYDAQRPLADDGERSS